VTNSARRDIDVELMPQSVVLEAQCVRKVCVCFLDVLVESCQLHKHALNRIGAPAAVIQATQPVTRMDLGNTSHLIHSSRSHDCESSARAA
jgi:hypothetical protein